MLASVEPPPGKQRSGNKAPCEACDQRLLVRAPCEACDQRLLVRAPCEACDQRLPVRFLLLIPALLLIAYRIGARIALRIDTPIICLSAPEQQKTTEQKHSSKEGRYGEVGVLPWTNQPIDGAHCEGQPDAKAQHAAEFSPSHHPV